jgi:hypothetical protein
VAGLDEPLAATTDNKNAGPAIQEKGPPVVVPAGAAAEGGAFHSREETKCPKYVTVIFRRSNTA